MNSRFAKFVALMLLVAQAWLSVHGGRVVCMSIDAPESVDCGDCNVAVAELPDSAPADAADRCPHEHAANIKADLPGVPGLNVAKADHAPCDKCVHLPVPEKTIAVKPADQTGVGPLFAQPIELPALIWPEPTSLPVQVAAATPLRAETPQAVLRSLQVTRLRV